VRHQLRGKVSRSTQRTAHTQSFLLVIFNGAAFPGANLDGAEFREAELSDVNFERASMVETDLSQAHGVTVEQLKKAKVLTHAKVPEALQGALAPFLGPGP
jgi:uncharacterized protein YjbI with pentapeptide repeats